MNSFLIVWNFPNSAHPIVHVARVIEQCCLNSTPDLFNGQTANFVLKPQKLIESRIYVKKKPIWSVIETKLHCAITFATAQQGKSARDNGDFTGTKMHVTWGIGVSKKYLCNLWLAHKEKCGISW